MSNYYIKEIFIEGFRGINNENSPLHVKFNFEGVTSFFAANGQGKSSIYEAIYYCINDKFPKIEKLHRDLRDYSTITNLFHSTDCQIKLVFIDETHSEVNVNYIIDSNSNKSITSPDITNPKQFINNLKDEHNFLDYATFTNIINESPEEAGKIFSALIGYSKFIEIKDKLEKISRTQNINYDFDISNKENKIKYLNDTIKNNQTEILNNLVNLKIKYKKYNRKIIENRILKELIDSFNFIKNKSIYDIEYENLLANLLGDNYNENINRQSQLLDLIKVYSDFSNLLKTLKKTDLNKLSTSLKKAYKNLENKDDLYLGSLYERAIAAYDYFTDIDKNTCVLCNTKNLGNAKQTFLDIIKIKISKYQKFKSELSLVINNFNSIINEFSLIKIEELLYSQKFLKEEDKVFTSFNKNSRHDLPEDFFIKSDFFQKIIRYKKYLSEKLKSLKNEYQNLSKKIPKNITTLNEKITSFKNIKNELEQIELDRNEINLISNELEKIEKWIKYINIIKQSFDLAYNRLMEQIANDINKDAKVLFQEIMTNNEIVPFLEKKSAGQKVNLMLEKFYSSSNKKAANLLSESYRNALCLSIYFATALRNISSSKFIVLDDITSSFDSGHQIKLIDVLERHIAKAGRKKRKQVILFTHDGELKKVLSNMNESKNNWRHYKITRTLDGSFTSLEKIDSNHLKNELINKLNRGDTDIGSKLREYFEETIFEIIESLNIPISYNEIYKIDDSRLENLLNSIERQIKLERSLNPSKVVVPILNTPYMRNIKDVANKVSHFKTNSITSYTPLVLKQFVDDIFDFKRKFMYNCNCHLNQGWVYFRSLTKKRNNIQCNC